MSSTIVKTYKYFPPSVKMYHTIVELYVFTIQEGGVYARAWGTTGS